VDEWYIIEAGGGEVHVGNEVLSVKPGDTVAVPKGTPQRAVNTSDEQMVFQVLCMPRFTMAGYEELE